MKYEMNVQIYLRPLYEDGRPMGGGQLELRETNQVDLLTLSDAAAVLVKLHEFFEEIRKRGAK